MPSFGALQIAFVAVKAGKSQAKVGDSENISPPTDTSGMSDALQQIFMFPPPFTIMIYGKNNHPSEIAHAVKHKNTTIIKLHIFCVLAEKVFHNPLLLKAPHKVFDLWIYPIISI